LTGTGAALNYQADANATAAQMSTEVTMTERAARRIGEILKAEPAGSMLRVSVEGGGCSGFQYKFGFEQAKAADDLVLARNGATVLIDPVSVKYMAGAEIDYVDDLIGASFKVNNPVATASCGCGTSFSI
jgi:iron-sulfur cluster assembly accessory protein